MDKTKKTVKIRINGTVQGVGFRPFLVRVAKSMGINGFVLNEGGFVTLTITAYEQNIKEFISQIKKNKPKPAIITKIDIKNMAYKEFSGFSILQSEDKKQDNVELLPDLPICKSCTDELFEKENSRFLHPFISCTECGPRYSILNSLPYDRENTTMGEFLMCEDCKSEYEDLTSKRFHAQTISCHHCKPTLLYKDKSGVEALEGALNALKENKIIAIKGVGGYHFAVTPFDGGAVNHLRLLKGREQKPFAVMFYNLEELKKYAFVSKTQGKLLLSAARPIVLLKSKKNKIAKEVFGESLQIGAFLPYTPLQLLLLKELKALVLTSANISGKPIIMDDKEILKIESPFLEGVLLNERKINLPLDDSVAYAFGKHAIIQRRSRGIVPSSLQISGENKSIFCAGGDLKACFCLSNSKNVYLSQYFGDLEENDVLKSYQKTFSAMKELFQLQPEIALCDMHKNYHSSRFAKTLGLKIVEVQHHHAHIASVMAENHINRAIGVAFDGTGYGTDGAIWGGEFLLCENSSFKRAGHLGYSKLIGGENSAENADKTLLCILSELGLEDSIKSKDEDIIKAALKNNINVVNSSSVGRLFDAVSSLLNLGHKNHFEGECAILLQNAAMRAKSAYPLNIAIKIEENMILLERQKLFETLIFALQKGENINSLALGFHKALAVATLNVCKVIRARENENTIALSGGVFQNVLLLEECTFLLKQNGFKVYFNKAVPTNDGGICFGQAYIAKNGGI